MQIGAIKIKDGFFVGDVYASKDVEFVILNKITRIVNCASVEVPNSFVMEGVLYYSFGWTDSTDNDQLKDKDSIDQAVDFINESIELGQSILIHSLKCQNRAIFMCACYLIKQFRWTASTSINFIYSRKLIPRMRVDLEKVLFEYEQLEKKPLQQLKTIIWSPEYIKKNISTFTMQEIVLANTFLNTYIQPISKSENKKGYGPRLQWNDRQATGGRLSNYKSKLCTASVPAYEQLPFTKPIRLDEEQAANYKPILKKAEGSTKILKQNLMETNINPYLGIRATSANNLSKTLKMQNDMSKRSKLNLTGSDKQFETEFNQNKSLAKRNTLDPRLLGRSLRKQNQPRSSSKEKKFEGLIASGKSRLSAFYNNYGCYTAYKPDKNSKCFTKPMKKIASSKMIRPHSGNPANGPAGTSHIKSFMEGLIKLSSQDFFEK